MRKNLRLNSGNEIGRSIERSLDEYFRKLDGEPPHGVYDMVIAHVERALLTSMLERAHGNQTHAADMLGMNEKPMPQPRMASMSAIVQAGVVGVRVVIQTVAPVSRARPIGTTRRAPTRSVAMPATGMAAAEPRPWKPSRRPALKGL